MVNIHDFPKGLTDCSLGSVYVIEIERENNEGWYCTECLNVYDSEETAKLFGNRCDYNFLEDSKKGRINGALALLRTNENGLTEALVFRNDLNLRFRKIVTSEDFRNETKEKVRRTLSKEEMAIVGIKF